MKRKILMIFSLSSALIFNIYILDILKNVEAEEVLLSMNTSLSPVCITAPAEENYIYIVTPVRVVF